MREGEKESRALTKSFRRQLTNAETILRSRLRRHTTLKFRRQHPIGPYVADFACIAARLVVEVDGETHSSETEQDHDAVRSAYIGKKGWRIIRVWNTDVYKSLNGVLDKIHFEAATPSGAPEQIRGRHPPRTRGRKELVAYRNAE